MNIDNLDRVGATECWWGDKLVKEGVYYRWAIGERDIIIQRSAHEWQVWNRQTADDTLSYCINYSAITSPQFGETLAQHESVLSRYIQQQTPEQLWVLPALADRSVVARPARPLSVLPGENVTLYVSTPLWFTAKLTAHGDNMIDMPFWRPSDSWFGASTLDGVMCYAKYTDARLVLTTIERRQHRAITPVQVVNHAKDTLAFERVNIPVTLLTLYADEQHFLWTNTLTLLRDDDKTTHIEIKQTPPSNFISAEPVNRARLYGERKTLIQRLSSLFA